MYRPIVWAFLSLCLCACESSSEGKERPGTSPNKVKDSIIQDLETRSGISLPIVAVMLNSYQGERDPQYDFHCWTIFSSSPISIQTMKPIRAYEPLWSSTVKVLEVSIRPRKMSTPTAVFDADWYRNNHEYRFHLVRTSEGDYLYVEQFRNMP